MTIASFLMNVKRPADESTIPGHPPPRPITNPRQGRDGNMTAQGLGAAWGDAWLLDGVRTPFADYTGAFAEISPIDLGIKAARAVLARAGVDPAAVGTVIAGSVAQASFDAYMLPRHIS